MAWGTIKGIAVHHSDSPEQDNHTRCVQTADAIRDYHMRNGYREVAYTKFGCKHGYVFGGRGYGDNPGSNGTTAANASYPSICIIGDHPKASPGVASAIKKFRAEVLRRWPGADEVKPHKAFVATACPGLPLTQWIRDKKYVETPKEETGLAILSNEAQEFFENTYRNIKKLDPPTSASWAYVLISEHRQKGETSSGSEAHSHTVTVTLE